MKQHEKENTKKGAKMKNTSLQKRIIDSFKEVLASFKNKKIIWIILYDLCFLLVAGVIAKTTSKLMASYLQKLGLTNVTSLTPEIISQQLGAIKTLAIFFFIITVIFYLIILLDYTLLRGWMWTKLMDTKPTKKYMKKFYLLNLIWVTGWIIVLSLAVTTLNQEYYKYMILIGAITYIHLTTVLHHAFTYKQEIKRAIGKAFTTGIGKLNQFIIPYIYITIVYIIATKIFTIIVTNTFSSGDYIIILALIILFMAWYRTYMNSIIRGIEKKR